LSGKINHTGRGGKSYEIAELAAEVGILRDRVEASISPWNGESGMQRTGLVTMRARSAHALHAYAFLRTAFRERAAPFAARGCERGPIPPHNKGSSRRLGASGRFILSRDATCDRIKLPVDFLFKGVYHRTKCRNPYKRRTRISAFSEHWAAIREVTSRKQKS
jgi:hypothetical protein